MTTVGMVGSRRRNTENDFRLCKDKLLQIYRTGDRLVSGGCPIGADNFAERLAKELDIPIDIYRAEWKLYGRSAGFHRNSYIARDADILIACVADDRTGGTEDTIRKFTKLGKTNLILI